MLSNCSGFYKEGKVTISAGLCYFHQDFLVKHRKTVLFTSNTKVENKFSKGEIISAWKKWRQVPMKNSVKRWNRRGPKPTILIKNKSSVIFCSILSVNLLG